MKQIHFFKSAFLCVALGAVLGACSNDELTNIDSPIEGIESAKHTVQMQFNGQVVGFDQTTSAGVTTKAESIPWKSGDKLYITFYRGSKTVQGEAIYDAASGWSVTYEGDLLSGADQSCEVRHFENADFQQEEFVKLNPHTAVYEDANATFSYQEGSLSVTATLKPKTGRIRFKGTAGERIFLTGINRIGSFDPTKNQYGYTDERMDLTVQASGYTPYIYGTADTISGYHLSLFYKEEAFHCALNDQILKQGESGYMTIPTESAPHGWSTGIYVRVNNVELKMMPVKGLESGYFLMAESEVPRTFYEVVYGNNITSQEPQVCTYNAACSLTQELNKKTLLQFDLPTEEQWLYAARGGAQSQNYLYAGSNDPDLVAVYGYAHNYYSPVVKLKAPNELGLYDMSGNVAEWVKKFVAKPTGEYTYTCYWRAYGGSCKNYVEQMKIGYYTEVTTSNHDTEADALASVKYDGNRDYAFGIRLIMTLEK